MQDRYGSRRYALKRAFSWIGGGFLVACTKNTSNTASPPGHATAETAHPNNSSIATDIPINTPPPPQPKNLDTDQLMYSQQIEEQYDLIVDGKNITNTADANEMNAQISPDGKYAIFYSDRNDGNNPERHNRLYRIDLMTHEVIPLIDTKNLIPYAHYYDPSYSRDGKKIAFKLDLGEKNEHGKIWTMSADGTNLKEIVLTDINGPIHGEMWKPAYNADGSVLFVTVGVRNESHIYGVDAEGNGLATKLTENDGFSHWFPAPHPTDNNLLAYVSNKSGHDEIYVMNLTTRESKQITHTDYDADDPSWNRNGTKIIGVVSNGKIFDVVTMNADGTQLTWITKNEMNELSPGYIR